jgi:hypothetical protein
MMQLIGLLIQMATGIVLPAILVRWDERRLSQPLLDRCWPESSFWCAVVAFGVFSIPVHFYRTRRSVLGLVQGLLWAVAIAVVIGLAGWMSGPVGT